MPLARYPRERDPGTHAVGGWVDPRAGLDKMFLYRHEKCISAHVSGPYQAVR
jgi:hypothetical protein